MRAHISIELEDPNQIEAVMRALSGSGHPMMATQDTQDTQDTPVEAPKAAPRTRGKGKAKAAPEQAQLPVEQAEQQQEQAQEQAPEEQPKAPAGDKPTVETLRAMAAKLAPQIGGEKVREMIRTIGNADMLVNVPEDRFSALMQAFQEAA